MRLFWRLSLTPKSAPSKISIFVKIDHGSRVILIEKLEKEMEQLKN